MREPETLKELIKYMEYSYDRIEEGTDVVMCLTDSDSFHELLLDLKKYYSL